MIQYTEHFKKADTTIGILGFEDSCRNIIFHFKDGEYICFRSFEDLHRYLNGEEVERKYFSESDFDTLENELTRKESSRNIWEK